MPARVIYTIGHSNHTLTAFIALLQAHAIRQLVDIRRHPGSRRLPHFNRPGLERSLTECGIGYHWMGEVFGGRRDVTAADSDADYAALPAGALRRYAIHMRSETFRDGITGLLQITAEPAALMCAENDPARCHRSLLSDYLQLSGFEIRHILATAASQPHQVHPAAAWEGTNLCYKHHGQILLELD